MVKRLVTGAVVIAGLGWLGVVTYLYFFSNSSSSSVLRREDQFNEFVIKSGQGVFLTRDATLHPTEERPALGWRAPDFELEDLTGSPVRLSDLEGKPILINFWASWCPPCRKEMPELQEFFTRYGEKIHVLGINWNDQPATVRDFLSRYGVTYINLLDVNGKVFVRYELTGLPTTFFLDEQRIIRGKWLGSMSVADMISAFQKTTRALDTE